MAKQSIGVKLREHVEDIIDRYVTRLRKDPAIPHAGGQSRPLLEDHAMTFLGDLFQTVAVLEQSQNDTEGEDSELLKDGSEIQRLIADLHGRQRFRIGWSETAVARDYEIMREEVETAARERATEQESDRLSFALDSLRRLFATSSQISIKAYVQAKKDGP